MVKLPLLQSTMLTIIARLITIGNASDENSATENNWCNVIFGLFITQTAIMIIGNFLEAIAISSNRYKIIAIICWNHPMHVYKMHMHNNIKSKVHHLGFQTGDVSEDNSNNAKKKKEEL